MKTLKTKTRKRKKETHARRNKKMIYFSNATIVQDMNKLTFCDSALGTEALGALKFLWCFAWTLLGNHSNLIA